MSEVISFGAGVNSVAMTIMLVNDGWQGPIVFADPGAEYPETYCYLDMFNDRWLVPRGLEVITISPTTTPDFYSPSFRRPLPVRCLEMRVVPLIVARWCTSEYKRRAVERWAKSNLATPPITLLGISLEEATRAERTSRGNRLVGYPLIDQMIDRDGCKDIIRAEGLPLPRKSGCYFCPFQRKAEWKALYETHPDLLQVAINMEAGARQRDPQRQPVQLGMNLNLPLAVARDRWYRQLELPEMPDRHYDYYQMCECRL